MAGALSETAWTRWRRSLGRQRSTRRWQCQPRVPCSFSYHRSMILDTLDNAVPYRGLGQRLNAAMQFLLRPETAELEPLALGSENSRRVEVDGDRIFALIQRYRTRPPAETFWEAHRKYID